jgi:hypothetical protein
MNINSKEHYDLMAQFERDNKLTPSHREKDKEWWKRGQVYENGEVNRNFIYFRQGYSFGKSIAQAD